MTLRHGGQQDMQLGEILAFSPAQEHSAGLNTVWLSINTYLNFQIGVF
jgi:hypothetical protein